MQRLIELELKVGELEETMKLQYDATNKLLDSVEQKTNANWDSLRRELVLLRKASQKTTKSK